VQWQSASTQPVLFRSRPASTLPRIARQAAFIYAGDHAENPSGGGASMTINSFYFLSGVNASGHDGAEVGLPELGPSGLNRLGEHVFTQPGVRTVIVQLGLNDIFQHDDGPDAIIAALQQTAVDLHQRRLRVLLSTIVPATGDPSWTPVREATRQAVNRYVRTTRDADGVVDLDRAVRDPANPAQLNPAFDGGDHVHPTAAGNRAIAEIVPLSRR
jgi:lysophospholipase L1-like esterase